MDAIESFRKFHSGNYEIILVDNGSTEAGWMEKLKNIPNLNLICLEKNLGFGPANNIAAKVAKGGILMLLNNDTITTSPFLTEIEREFKIDPSLGIIGPRIFNSDGSQQLSYGKFPSIMIEIRDKIIYRLVDNKNKLAMNYFNRRYSKRKFTDWVTGAALFIKKDLFIEVGGFDESFFMYFEDKELCKRVKDSGKKIAFIPDVSLIHLRGGSADGPKKNFLEMKYRESQCLYYEKHRAKFEQQILRLYLKLSGKEFV
jgi:N-acetylglucosaminyl-diphospho-decaprenol L-rhamnosyltransferase